MTILGTVILAGLAGLVTYYLTQSSVMTVAAGPEGGIDAKLVAAINKKIAKERDKIDLRLVATAGPKESAQALIDHKADLAILPSTIGRRRTGRSSPSCART